MGGGQNTDFRFTTQAVCVPFLLAYILHRRGIGFVFSRMGREPTGDPFDADPKWLEVDNKQVPFNPVINAGAILMASMLPEETTEARRENFLAFVRKACKDDNIDLDTSVHKSESEFGEKTADSPGSYFTVDASSIGLGQPGKRGWTTLKPFSPIIFYACSLKVSCDDLATLLRCSPLAGTRLPSLNSAFLLTR